MKRLFTFAFFIVVTTGCLVSERVEPTQQLLPTSLPTPTISPSPSATTINTFTPLPATETSTITPTPPPSQTPDPSETVLIEFGYYQVSGGADFEFVMGFNIPDLVVYANGHLLTLRPRSPVLEKTLTTDEICALLRAIDAAGFNQVTTDGTRQLTDPLYSLPTDAPNSYDANEYRVLVNGETPKEIWVYEPLLEYVIPPMENTLDLLTHYQPSGLRPYTADKLILWARSGRYEYMDQNEQTLPWPENLPALSEILSDGLYLEGPAAQAMFENFGYPYDRQVFTDAGQEFTVLARPILPHENQESIIETRGIVSRLAAYSLPFTCPP